MATKKKVRRHQVNVKLTGTDEAELRARAAADRRTVSDWVRVLIQDALAIGPKLTRTAAGKG